jgi:hypothetical protein
MCVFAFSIVLFGLGCALKGIPVEFSIVTTGGASGASPSPPIEVVARSADQAREALKRLGGMAWGEPQAKIFTDNVDYVRDMILIISPGPQGSTSDNVRVDGIQEEDMRIVAYYSRQFQQAGGAVVTTPFAIVKMKRSDKPVEFVFRR